VVTRRRDVFRVLTDPESYPLPYARRLPGPFVLGLTGEEFDRQRKELSAVLRSDDLPGLASHAEARAEVLVGASRPRGYCEVGGDLVYPVMDAVVRDYLGVPGPAADTQLRWARDLFQDIFLNFPDLAAPRERGERAAREMGRHVDGLITARRARGIGCDDVLGRLLDGQRTHPEAALDDAEIRENLIGMAIGWLWHGAKACLIAVDELLERPDALVQARAAARDGEFDALRRVLWEVLRFRPVQAGLPRTCARASTLGTGTSAVRKIRAGTQILVGTQSAMWDELAIPDPARFDASRAEEQYLLFGAGPHRCLGEHIMRAQLPALLAPLLRIDGLRRAPGSAGYLRWDGAAPATLSVRFPV
jgi:cytochrome P450